MIATAQQVPHPPFDWSDDSRYVWHPYASASSPPPVFPVVAADGVELELSSGKKIIDGMSSWWAAAYGYNHPHINAAITQQLSSMAHVMFGGLTHEPAITLCKRLVQLTPRSLSKVFLADSGSVAVEVAMKMCLQYCHASGQPQKSAFVTTSGGYHGDTWNAMSVSDPENGMHHLFKGRLGCSYFANRPSIRFNESWCSSDLESMAQILKQHSDTVAAVILEPIAQGAGGMWFYHPQYLNELRSLCDQHEVLLIFDEIATGLGRLGKLFATDFTSVEPDILCLGKALTGGYLTLAATLASDKIVEGLSTQNDGVFMHGPTFMGNPLACAAANAALDLCIEHFESGSAMRIEAQLKRELLPLGQHPQVADVRVLGAIGVLETHQPLNMKKAPQFFVEHGVWIRPFGKLFYIMPPLICSSADLSKLTGVMARALATADLFE